MAFVFAALFLAVWWRAGLGRQVLAFAAGYAAFALGFIVTHLLPTGAAATFFVTQAFYSLASVLLIWGACHRAGRPAHLRTLFGIYCIAAVSLLAAVSISDDAGPRLVLINAGYAMMFLVAFVSLADAPRRTLVDTAILIVLALHTVDFMVRPVLTSMAEGAIPAAEYRESLYYTIINMVLMLKTLNTAIVLLGACVYDGIVKVREGANIDPLTSLCNRRAFEAEVARTLSQSTHTGEQVSLVIADIDHFKQVNDLWGHQAGDKAIAGMGTLLARMSRPHDLLGRVGGEEFCILVRHCGEADAAQLADRMRLAFARSTFPEIGDHISLTASFGVAERRPGESYDRLFSRADAALYAAKNNGRNRIERGSQPAVPLCEDACRAAA
ncbi:GGDEF domain-containing protein [Aurantiacibacter sediminis]|nr:GGDEF domain-containing protein [Aurantiacibacter sediminis]